ncbi:hypothetical protein BDQ17DRAFT_1357444 [Cyathus striatus]|nr:hypothetical protein BDQ17DRAFT_1357444 [Cyathus striatus]
MSDIQHGKIYRIVNWRSKTAIDLGQDGRTVTGSDVGDSLRQQWLVEERDSSGMWTVKSSSGKYLGFKGHTAGLRDGLAVTVVEHAFEWQILEDESVESVHRLYVPYTWYNLELYTPNEVYPSGLRVTLGKTRKPVREEQVWSFELVG